jgi:hypothetical protein
MNVWREYRRWCFVDGTQTGTQTENGKAPLFGQKADGGGRREKQRNEEDN